MVSRAVVGVLKSPLNLTPHSATNSIQFISLIMKLINLISSSGNKNHLDHYLSAETLQTLMFPSLKPANNFFPKAFQVKEVHCKALADFWA